MALSSNGLPLMWSHNKLTQVELAKKLDVDFTTINRLENGHFKPSYEVLSKFETLKEQIGENEIMLPKLSTTNLTNDISNLIEKSNRIAY